MPSDVSRSPPPVPDDIRDGAHHTPSPSRHLTPIAQAFVALGLIAIIAVPRSGSWNTHSILALSHGEVGVTGTGVTAGVGAGEGSAEASGSEARPLVAALERSAQAIHVASANETSREAPGGNATSGGEDQSAVRPARFALKILASYPHDPGAFTQGLELERRCVVAEPERGRRRTLTASEDGIVGGAGGGGEVAMGAADGEGEAAAGAANGGDAAVAGAASGGDAAVTTPWVPSEQHQHCVDVLWESTGLHGRSRLREVEKESGLVLRERSLGPREFGEGLTRLGGSIYQVTWRSPKMYRYDVDETSSSSSPSLSSSPSPSSSPSSRASSRHSRALPEPTEMANPLGNGWGIANDGERLIVGDATDALTWLDPETGEAVRAVRVRDRGAPVVWLNELEWVEGHVLANVWARECLAKIDPATGAVVAWVDARGIKRRMLEDAAKMGRPAPSNADVLNGIAWDPRTRRLLLTGKHWPLIYEAALQPLPDDPRALEQLRDACIITETNGFT